MDHVHATEMLNRVSNLPESTLEICIWAGDDNEACLAAGASGDLLRAAARAWDIDCTAMAEMGLGLKLMAAGASEPGTAADEGISAERLNSGILAGQKEKEARAERTRAWLESFPRGAYDW